MTKEQEENFCYLPFVQLLLQPTGAISPCCWAQDIVLGNVPEERLEEIWNGEKIRSLRREFLSGDPVTCKTRMRQIGCHRYNRGPYTENPDLSEIQVKGPRRLDVRLNGRCNLQCVMCDVWKQPNGKFDDSDFWTKGPEQIFPYLMELDVLGGEPFVQADTYRLIDEVSKVNEACTWAFVTNGNYNFQPIRKRLEKIRLRWMMVSLDSVVPDTYKKIRKGGNLKRTLETIDALDEFNQELRKDSREFDFSVSMCVQKENWREIGQFLTYCEVVNICPWLQFAYAPSSLSLLSLSRAERVEVLQYLEKLAQRYGQALVNSIHQPIADSLKEGEVVHERSY